MAFKIILTLIMLCVNLTAVAANISLMPIKDIKPGMHGIGKTVISGDTIEDFDVEILGVTGSEAAGYNIFVRLYGSLIDKTGGVAQGMSGSPVYVDGRLVGAVAYGRTFNDPHYCFLTPIGSMLRMLDEPARRDAHWIPQGTPLMAGGFTEYGLEYLQERLNGFGFQPVGSGSTDVTSKTKLEPGSAVGVAIMKGDLTLGALGTVTWTDDNGRVLAFGHPFMQRGNSGFFMTKSWILGCVPNLQSSYKVGTIGDALGHFDQDRFSGIGGVIGKLPPTVPVFVSVADKDRGVTNSTRVNVIEDAELFPAVVDAAVVNTASKTMDRNGGGTAKVVFTITGRDQDKKMLEIKRENMYYAVSNLLKNINVELSDATSVLMKNKFTDIDVYGVTVETELSEAVQVAEIISVKTDKSVVKPGEKVEFTVELKPYRGESFQRKINFIVPEKYSEPKLALNVRGGSSFAWVIDLLRKQKEEGAPAAKKKEKQRTLFDYVKNINNADKNNEIIIDLSSGKRPDEEQPDTGLEGLLHGSPYKKKYPFDFIVDGEVEVVLTVK